MPRLLAISDLHLSHPSNRAALAELGHYPDDWLIVAGDIGPSPDHLRLALDTLVPRFAHVVWAPGNHDLWASASHPQFGRGLGLLRKAWFNLDLIWAVALIATGILTVAF